MAGQGPTKAAAAALAAAKAKAAHDRINEVWTARKSIRYEGARKVPTVEVTNALAGLEWEDEYLIAGKTNHVCDYEVHNILNKYKRRKTCI